MQKFLSIFIYKIIYEKTNFAVEVTSDQNQYFRFSDLISSWKL